MYGLTKCVTGQALHAPCLLPPPPPHPGRQPMRMLGFKPKMELQRYICIVGSASGAIGL